MRATLNIGLARDGQSDLSPAEAFEALQKRFEVGEYRVAQSGTELTLIAEVKFGDGAIAWDEARLQLYYLSVGLSQDCIAILRADGIGKLVGPRADAWGEFNPEYFLPL